MSDDSTRALGADFEPESKHTPDVALIAVRLPLANLRRHVVRRADDSRRGGVRTFEHLGDAEVAKFDETHRTVAPAGDEDVLSLRCVEVERRGRWRGEGGGEVREVERRGGGEVREMR